MKITRIETDLLRVPLPRPVDLPASQVPRSTTTVEVVLVRVLTDGEHTGLGFAYLLGGGGVAVRSVIDTVIADMLAGGDPTLTELHFTHTWAKLEGLGFVGLTAQAYAAIDFALWDLKGKAAGMPVYKLLGGYGRSMKAIVCDTASSALGRKRAVSETRAALDRGAAGVQVQVGIFDPEMDEERVRQLREDVPDGAWFEVSANSRYDFATAVWLGTIGAEELGLDGFNDPLRPDDLVDLGRLIERLDIGVAVGALYDRPDDYLRVIDRGGISAIRIDPQRVGGITPARKIAHAAELKHIAIYPVRLPEIGVHLSAGVQYGRMCEYVDWFAELFEGGPQFHNGQLVAPTGPGLGLTLNEAVASKWRV